MRFMSVMLGLLCLPLLAVAIILSPIIVPVLFLLAAVVPGLAVLRKTSSKRSWNLASYHSPHSLTWRWIVRVTVGSALARPCVYLSPRESYPGHKSPFVVFAFNTGIAGATASTNNYGWQFGAWVLGVHISFDQQRPMWYRDMIQREWDEQATRVNRIEALARDQYREGVSAGAAARQMCRSLSHGSTLKRMLEDMLADGNRAAHDRHCILRDFKSVAPEAGRTAEMDSFRRINRLDDAPGQAWPASAMPAAIQ